MQLNGVKIQDGQYWRCRKGIIPVFGFITNISITNDTIGVNQYTEESEFINNKIYSFTDFRFLFDKFLCDKNDLLKYNVNKRFVPSKESEYVNTSNIVITGKTYSKSINHFIIEFDYYDEETEKNVVMNLIYLHLAKCLFL